MPKLHFGTVPVEYRLALLEDGCSSPLWNHPIATLAWYHP
eukprot:IDg14020t1